MRFLLTLLLAFLPVVVYAGELRVRLDSMRRTCIGDELMVYARIENFNAGFSVHDVLTTATIKQGATVVGTKVLSEYDLTPTEIKSLSIATGWIPTLTGAYSVEVSADGSDDINGPQSEIKSLVVCPASTPCPERPTVSSTIIYLGDGTTGSVTYSSDKPECCYEVKFTIVAGRDAVSAHSPETWTKVPPTANVSVTVNRIKWNDTYIVGRVDWRTCDRTKSGSDYILIRDGNKPAASAPTPQAPGTTAGQTPQSGTDGDPVVTATREFAHTISVVDIESISELPSGMHRSYSSLLSTAVHKDHDFGPGWSHAYDWFAVRGDGEVYVHGPSGFRARFRQEGQNWVLDWPQDGAYSIAQPNDSTLYFGDGRTMRVIGFDKAGRIQFVDNTFGFRNTMNYTGRWISSITTPTGRGLTLTRDSLGLIQVITNGQTSVQYGYGAGGVLSTFTNAKGNATRYNYVPGTHFLTSWTTPEGRTPFTNEYDIDGRVTRQDYGDGFTVGFANANNVTTMTYPLGITRVHKHDSQHRLTELTGSNGARASFRYDSRGNRNQISDLEGSVLDRTFVDGMPSSVTYPNGAEWNVTYTPRTYLGLSFRDVASINLKSGLSYLYERNPNGTLKSTTQPNGNKTTYEYSIGHLPNRIRGFGLDVSYTYNLDGLVTNRTSAGVSWDYTRDLTGNLTQVKKDNVVSATIAYDLNADVTSFTNGQITWKYGYDKDRNTITTTDPLNRNWSLVRDTRNRVTEYRNPIETSIKYNWLGPILTSLEFAGGVRYTVTPNSSGLPLIVTNAKGDTWGVTTDNEGVPTQYSLPGGIQYGYQSDDMGFITSLTSPLGKSRHFGYDPYGLVNSLTTQDGVQTTTQRNTNLTSGTTECNGVTIDFESAFTSSDILRTQITDGEGNDWTQTTEGSTNKTTFTTPSGHAITALLGGRSGATEIDWGAGLKGLYTYDGSRTSGVTIGSESMTWKYNLVGELVKMNGDSILRNGAGSILTTNGITTERGAGGRINRVMFDAMPVYTYRYDNRGYVDEIEDSEGGKTTVHTNARGRITGYDFIGGFKLNYDWNNDDQITRVSTSDGWWMDYVRDDKGRPTEITRSDNVPLSQPFNLDVQYNSDGKESNATYDGLGNYQFSGSYGLKLSYGSFGAKTFTDTHGDQYSVTQDDYGNVKKIARDSAEVEAEVLQHIVSMFQVKAKGETWKYVGMPTGRLLYGLNSKGERNYLIDDGLGNIVAERNDAGTYTGSRAFTPFGVTVGKTGSPGVLGYKGLTGGLTYGFNDDIMFFGRNYYSPDYGRYLNTQNTVYGIPNNTAPRWENFQSMNFDPFGWYRPIATDLNINVAYTNPCSMDPGSIVPTKRDQLRIRWDVDLWDGEFSGRNSDQQDQFGLNSNFVRDVLKIGYSELQQTDDVEHFIRASGLESYTDPSYGYGQKPRISVGMLYNWSPLQGSLFGGQYEPPDDSPITDLYGLIETLFPESGTLTTPTPTPSPEPNHQTLQKK